MLNIVMLGGALADAPKIRDIKNAHESLWQFLAALPSSMEAQIFYALLLAGVIGMFASWLLKWARGQAAPLYRYLFTDDVRFTVLAAAAYFGICLTAISSGIFVTDEGVFVGWANVLWFGLTNGFGADTVANKGSNQPKEIKP